jgi:hypothetical protein
MNTVADQFAGTRAAAGVKADIRNLAATGVS